MSAKRGINGGDGRDLEAAAIDQFFHAPVDEQQPVFIDAAELLVPNQPSTNASPLAAESPSYPAKHFRTPNNDLAHLTVGRRAPPSPRMANSLPAGKPTDPAREAPGGS